MDGLLKVGNECVGRALLDREGFREPQRPRLVGLRAVDAKAVFSAGAQITAADTPSCSVGHVTSSVYSPALRQWIGLALVGRHLATEGTELLARDPIRNRETRVKVAAVVHFDAKGERMKA
jgi:sarcosine oxidase subunit alpha